MYEERKKSQLQLQVFLKTADFTVDRLFDCEISVVDENACHQSALQSFIRVQMEVPLTLEE